MVDIDSLIRAIFYSSASMMLMIFLGNLWWKINYPEQPQNEDQEKLADRVFRETGARFVIAFFLGLFTSIPTIVYLIQYSKRFDLFWQSSTGSEKGILFYLLAFLVIGLALDALLRRIAGILAKRILLNRPTLQGDVHSKLSIKEKYQLQGFLLEHRVELQQALVAVSIASEQVSRLVETLYNHERGIGCKDWGLIAADIKEVENSMVEVNRQMFDVRMEDKQIEFSAEIPLISAIEKIEDDVKEFEAWLSAEIAWTETATTFYIDLVLAAFALVILVMFVIVLAVQFL